MGLLHGLYSDSPDAYAIGPPIGHGASSIVYSATYHPTTRARRSTFLPNPPAPIECALKVVDLDALPLKSLQQLKRETQLMSLSKHPNVLRVRGTWMKGHKLYIAMRLMKSGSVADVMRYGYPDGLEEEVCRCVLKQALEGLRSVPVSSRLLSH
jgi:serine/threonine-protein kinase OSR1/STK39